LFVVVLSVDRGCRAALQPVDVSFITERQDNKLNGWLFCRFGLVS